MTPKPWEIRGASEADWQHLRYVRLRAPTHDPTAFVGRLAEESAWGPQQWIAACRAARWAMAMLGGGPIGVAKLSGKPPVHYMEAVWVDPDHRQRGVAASLLAEFLTPVADAGAQLRAWVLEGNDVAAAVYERLGFRPTGLVQPLPTDEDRTETELVLARP